MAGTAAVFVGKNRINNVAAAVFGTADEAFAFMEVQLDRVQQTLDKSHQRFSGLSELAERLKTTEADLTTEFEPLAQTLDDMYSELQAAERLLDASEAVARGINRIFQSMAVSQAAAAREDGDDSTGVPAKKIAEFSAGVADALDKFQIIRQELIALRDKKTLAREVAAAMISRVADLDARLVTVSKRIDAFRAHVSTTRMACVELEQRIHWWIKFAAVTLILILLWFGVSQIGMMKHGSQFAGHATK
jgi:chromosome segregation ATPase